MSIPDTIRKAIASDFEELDGSTYRILSVRQVFYHLKNTYYCKFSAPQQQGWGFHWFNAYCHEFLSDLCYHGNKNYKTMTNLKFRSKTVEVVIEPIIETIEEFEDLEEDLDEPFVQTVPETIEEFEEDLDEPFVQTVVEPVVQVVPEPVVETIEEFEEFEEDLDELDERFVETVPETIDETDDEFDETDDELDELEYNSFLANTYGLVPELVVEPVVQVVPEPVVETIEEFEDELDELDERFVEPFVEPVVETIEELVVESIGDRLIEFIVNPIDFEIIDIIPETIEYYSNEFETDIFNTYEQELYLSENLNQETDYIYEFEPDMFEQDTVLELFKKIEIDQLLIDELEIDQFLKETTKYANDFEIYLKDIYKKISYIEPLQT